MSPWSRRPLAVAAAVAALVAAPLAVGQADAPSPDVPPAATTPTDPAAPTTPTTPTTPVASPPIDLTIEANGDFLVHAPVWQAASARAGGHGYDFASLFKEIRPYVARSDLALCHVETPLTPRPPRGYPVFNTPTALARAIRTTGWDACSTASNHTLDQGQYGVDHTLAALRANGIAAAGSASSAAGATRIAMLQAKGVKVAFLAYTQISNGQVQPEPWSLSWATASGIIADARRARRQGAQVVIVNVHGGDEYSHEPNAAQRALADTLAASPAITAVVGQHVHVVQRIGVVHGMPVVFGEGNLISNQGAFARMPAGSQDGILALLRIRVTPGADAVLRRVDYVPVYVRHPDFTVVPVGIALRRGEGPAGELRASWQRTLGVVGQGARYGPWRRAVP